MMTRKRWAVIGAVVVVAGLVLAVFGWRMRRASLHEIGFSRAADEFQRLTSISLPKSLREGKAMGGYTGEGTDLYMRFLASQKDIELIARSFSMKYDNAEMLDMGFEGMVRIADSPAAWWSPPAREELVLCGVVKQPSWQMFIVGRKSTTDGFDVYVAFTGFHRDHLYNAGKESLIFYPRKQSKEDSQQPRTR